MEDVVAQYCLSSFLVTLKTEPMANKEIIAEIFFSIFINGAAIKGLGAVTMNSGHVGCYGCKRSNLFNGTKNEQSHHI